MSSNTPAAFGDVFEALERNNVPYVTVGGVAVVLHGHVRPIGDLDIVIPSTPDEQNHALQTLLQAGFVPSIPAPLSMLTVLRMFDQSAREIDVFVNYPIPFNELWASSEQIRVGEQTARVISLEHLLRAERFYNHSSLTRRPHNDR